MLCKAVVVMVACKAGIVDLKVKEVREYVRANQPSSSSRRVRAGRGAPGPSCSYNGSLTPPSPPNGLKDDSLLRIGVSAVLLLAEMAGSRRLHPREFIESLNEDEAMMCGGLCWCCDVMCRCFWFMG